jgi:hypothetical protein
MVDALAAEGLPQLRDTLAGLTAADWERPTRLQPPEPGRPPWTVLELAAHFDVFMGLALGLVAEPTSAQPVVDRASFYLSVSDRSTVAPVIYQYIVGHAHGHTPATILELSHRQGRALSSACHLRPPHDGRSVPPLKEARENGHRGPTSMRQPAGRRLNESGPPQVSGVLLAQVQ